MSGILKPLVKSSRALTGSPVSADKIISYEKQVIPRVLENTEVRYHLVIPIDTENTVKEITWKYANEADIDADILWLDSNICAATA